MTTVEFNGKDYPVRNSPEEFTIEELEIIMFILQKEDINIFSKWMEIISILGVDQDVIDNIDTDAFIELCLTFKFSTDIELTKEIEIDGVTYFLFEGDEFKIKMKQLKEIEDIVRDRKFYFAKLCANLYKTKGELMFKNEKEQKKYLEDFFKNQKSSIVIPILNIVNGNLIKKFNLMIENGIA